LIPEEENEQQTEFDEIVIIIKPLLFNNKVNKNDTWGLELKEMSI
jgi:hypothetical protein